MWRMRIACWITKAANTHLEYVMLVTFALQRWLRYAHPLSPWQLLSVKLQTAEDFYAGAV